MEKTIQELWDNYNRHNRQWEIPGGEGREEYLKQQ